MERLQYVKRLKYGPDFRQRQASSFWMFIYISASCITVLAKRGIWSFNYSLSCTLLTCPWKHILQFVTSACILCQVSGLSFSTFSSWFEMLAWEISLTKLQDILRKTSNQYKQITHTHTHPLNLGCTNMTLGSQIATHPGHGVKPLIFIWMLDTLGSTSLLNSGPTPIPQDLLALLSPEFPILMPLPSARVLHSDTSATSLPPFPPCLLPLEPVITSWSLAWLPFSATFPSQSWPLFSCLLIFQLTSGLPHLPTKPIHL